MSSKRNNSDEPHGIRLPGSILDQIKGVEDDENSSRFNFGSESYNKKRKAPVSRKEQRKQERSIKKQRKVEHGKKKQEHQHSKPEKGKLKKPKSTPSAQLKKKQELPGQTEEEFAGFSSDDELSSGDFDDISEDLNGYEEGGFSDDADQPQTAEDTIKALMELKAKKNMKKAEPKKKSKEPSVIDTMALLEAAKKEKNKNKNKRPIVEGPILDSFDDEEDLDDFDDLGDEFDDAEDQPQTAEDVMAALKAAKQKKNKSSVKEDMKSRKDEKKSKKSEKLSKGDYSRRTLTDEEEALIKRDERDMKHYAKLLGMKSTKLKDFKNDIDDGLGDLLDGLDFLDDYENGASSGQEYEDENPMDDVDEGDNVEEDDNEANEDDEEEIVENPFSSDDEIDSSDFDSDLDPDLEDDDAEDGDVIMAGPKENPYVAPVAAKKYIPPAMRARMAGSGDSEVVLKVKRSIKGPLNKLSEANVLTIVNEVNSAYLDNPRQVVTECLTSTIVDSVLLQPVLLDTFVTLHAALVAAIYRLQGVEFGAYFIQTLVEKYDEHYKAKSSKESGNLLTLLTACYSFQVISSKLLYNLISTLITETSEINSELLLRIVRNAGHQMRSDDPNALKEIILQFQQSVQGKEVNARTKFLIETITNLRNNKSKNTNELTQQLIIRMKKTLATVNNRTTEPLQVSLDDIHNVETKGKWWLVGSAWRDNMASGESKGEEVEVNAEELNDILDSAEPNWMEVARSQRMNTDIRRAIFISIMSSQDYIEAFTKLDKLGLKRSQEREIPKILLHCVSMEKVYNPYYGLLANKLCSQHSLRKTFQFSLWDFLRELEGDDEKDNDDEDQDDYFKRLSTDISAGDEDFQLQRIVNMGKFFGVLLAEGSLALHSLKNLNFLALNQDLGLFLEVLMISFFDNIGKKSEVAPFGAGSTKSKKADDLRFDDKLLLQQLAKCKEQKVLLRGLQYFLQEKVRGSDILGGRKQRKRVQWGVDVTCDIADELLKAFD